MIRSFALRALVFFLPLVVYLASSTGVVVYSGELMPLRDVAVLQTGAAPVLYGRAYRVNFFAFKLIATQIRKPQVLMLGSSHVMQFRSQFLNKQSAAFYNGGGAIHNLSEIHEFLYHLDGSRMPQVLMLGLDAAWYNTTGIDGFSERTVGDPVDDESWPPTYRLMNLSKEAFGDVLSGKIRLGQVLAKTEPIHGVQAIGLNAIVNGVGFRNDGSVQSGTSILHHPTAQEVEQDGLKLMSVNMNYYSRGDHVVESRLNETENLLRYAKDRNIFVIAFSPPFAPSLYAHMMVDGGYQYLPELALRLKALFEQYHFAYFDFSNAAALGATDDEMIDEGHASELLSLKMYIRMLEDLPEVLGKYSDLTYLQQVLEQPGLDRFDLFADYLSAKQEAK